MNMSVNNAYEALVEFDPEHRIVKAGPGFVSMTGLAPDDIVNLDFFSLVHPDDGQRVSDLWGLVANGSSQGAEFRLEIQGGKSKWVSALLIPIHDESGLVAGVQGSLRDIHEQKLLQAQLIHSQRLESIGLLSGGIAHDFNNLLTAIIGYCQMALSEMKIGSRAYDRVQQVLRAGERAASLTRQLLAFSRRQSFTPSVLDLNAVVDDVNKMLRRMIGEDTELVAIFSPGVGRVRADHSQLEQVIINLAVNARDAMPNGGTLTIQTASVSLDEPLAVPNGALARGEYVVLSVSDTGSGMDEQTLSQIFEPFFTTKEEGKGTGLGLSTVSSIVKQSGGEISVESEVGKGTTFRVYLPRVDADSTALYLEDIAQRPEAGTETILIAEDDDTLLNMASDVLSFAGYSPLQATSAQEAMQLCETYSGHIHLLLTDIVMPRTNGSELAERAALLRPNLKILFMSGYADDAVERKDISTGERPILQKPFTAQSLLRCVRETLDVDSDPQKV